MLGKRLTVHAVGLSDAEGEADYFEPQVSRIRVAAEGTFEPANLDDGVKERLGAFDVAKRRLKLKNARQLQSRSGADQNRRPGSGGQGSRRRSQYHRAFEGNSLHRTQPPERGEDRVVSWRPRVSPARRRIRRHKRRLPVRPSGVAAPKLPLRAAPAHSPLSRSAGEAAMAIELRMLAFSVALFMATMLFQRRRRCSRWARPGGSATATRRRP